MKKLVKTLLCVSLSALMIFSFAACGSSASKYDSSYDSYDNFDAASDSYIGNYSYSDSYDYEEWDEEEEIVSEETTEVSDHDAGNADAFVIESNEKLVYRCTIEMETLNFDDSVNAMRALINKYDGFIESETQTDDSYNWYYTTYEKTSGSLKEYITIRIPTRNYDSFLAEMEGNGKVTSKNQSVENITRDYYDVQTTIASLRTQEKRLLEMMEECTTIEEMITVEDRLSEVQNELSIYQSRLNTMDADVAYSTIDITIREVVKYDPEIKTDTFGDRLVNTITDSISVFLSFLEGLLFFIIYALPIGSVIGVIAFLIVLLVRAIVKSVRKRNAKKAAKESAKKEATPVKSVVPTNNAVPTNPAAPKKED